ncbi:MAG: tripartite tricarboxylate transporter permease, partial [Oscillospiraceae bacterium]
SEIFSQVEGMGFGHTRPNLPPPSCKDDERFNLQDLKHSIAHWLRSSALGCGIGALPGLGPALACYVGYDAGKHFSKHPDEFGKGSLEGVACAESANNAVCGANMIPLLSLGVPGDTGAAILMGAFMVQGLTPGPLVFQQSPQTVFNIYAGLILCNFALILIVLLTWRAFKKVCSVNTSIIFPIVLMFCVVGVYALNRSLMDVWTMLFFAVLGYVLVKFKFPMPTVIIGFILAPLFEKNFRRALVLSNGNFASFFSSPLCWAFWIATIVSVAFILYGKHKDKNLQDGL